MIFRLVMLLLGWLAFLLPVSAEAPVHLTVQFPYSLNGSKEIPASVGSTQLLLFHWIISTTRKKGLPLLFPCLKAFRPGAERDGKWRMETSIWSSPFLQIMAMYLRLFRWPCLLPCRKEKELSLSG